MMEPIDLEPGSTLPVLTGAGISAASGLRPFRGVGGLVDRRPGGGASRRFSRVAEQP